MAELCPTEFNSYAPGRGQIIITKPIKDLKFQGIFEIFDGHYYFRTIENRVLIGGGWQNDVQGEETSEIGTSKVITDSLYDVLKKYILPGIDFEVDMEWGGIMGFWKNHQKDINVREVDRNVFAGVSCFGVGVALTYSSG